MSSDVYESNRRFARPNQPTAYQTQLGPAERSAFIDWVHQNHVPYDPSPNADYDMPGFFHSMVTGHPRAQQGMNSNDGQMHYDDYWKTPYHHSFSAESQWAMPGVAPQWINDYQLAEPNGREVYNEKTHRRFGQ